MTLSRYLACTCLLFLLLAGIAVAAENTAPREFVPVQDGFSDRTESVLPYAADRLLVQFTPEAMMRLEIGLDKGARLSGAATGLTGVDALARAAGVARVERPYRTGLDKSATADRNRWLMFHFDGTPDLPALADALADDADVTAVSLDWRAFPAAVPNDTYYPDHWGHNNTGQMVSYDWNTHTHTGPTVGTPGFDGHAEEAWDKSQGYGDPSIVIAILDSGVDIDHPDLNLVAGYDFGDNDTNPDDNSASPGHGTACAGVAAAIADNALGVAGIAGGSAIMPCKVANSAGSMYFSAIQNALYWAADNGADVISLSLGAAISSDPATDSALQYAWNAGCVIVAATGNENNSVISYPAVHDVVMGIGAASPCGDRKRSAASSLYTNPGVSTDPNDYTCDGERWWGSNYGSTTQDSRGAVDIIAPTILPTTDIGGSGGYDPSDYSMTFNGTSCATPYAAGVAALVMAANPTYTNADVWTALTSTATDVQNVESGAGWDRYSGYGMVNADAAIGNTGPVPPTASFSGAPLSGTFPLDVTFTDASGGAPTGWSWTFGDGGTSTLQSPTYTYTAAGVYTVSLTVSNAQGNDTLTRTDYITVTEPGVTTFVTANAERTTTGTVSGSMADTYAQDGVAEVLTEEQYTGHPRKTYSYLAHEWDFDLPAGGAATLHLVASRTANGEGDNFVFEYSTDGVNWASLATITSSSYQTFALDMGTLSGAVTVRTYDTDRNWGNIGLDALSVDYLAFELGDVQPVAPTADFVGTPTSGDYPLAVQFTDTSAGAPTSWSWTFGDGGTSTAQNPSHTYTAAGTYTVSLTATNAQGADTATKTGYITVTEPGTGGDAAHVESITVTRKSAGPNRSGVCDVVIRDGNGAAVGNATVSVSYDGPNSGALSGVTDGAGVVNFETAKQKNPSGEWCFEVTNVTHATFSYDSGANVVTRACESGNVFGADGRRLPTVVSLDGNAPNPFNPMTEIMFSLPRATHVTLAVYNVRGELVATLVDGSVGAGEHRAVFDGRGRPSGVYFTQLRTPDHTDTRKMLMLK